MIHPLECHKFVNRSDGILILRRHEQLTTVRQRGQRVADRGTLGDHDASPRYELQMDERGRREIAVSERAGDALQMRANLCHARCVIDVASQFDAPAVGHVVEVVRRRVLIDAHRLLPALL